MIVAVAVPPAFDAETCAAYTPTVVAVPEIAPDAVSRLNPGGRPTAVNWVGLLVAVIVARAPLAPSVLVSAAAFVILGAGGTAPIVKVKVAWLWPIAFVAEIGTVKIPDTVGRPEIAPVAGFSASPAGRFVAAKAVGLFVAEIVYVKSVATYPSDDAAEERTGVACGSERIVNDSVPNAVPGDVDAERETAKIPAEAGVPVIWRVEEL